MTQRRGNDKPAEIARSEAKLLPSDHGPGEPVIAGALLKMLERLVESGGAVSPSLETGYVVPFDPEVFNRVFGRYIKLHPDQWHGVYDLVQDERRRQGANLG